MEIQKPTNMIFTKLSEFRNAQKFYNLLQHACDLTHIQMALSA